MDIIYSLFIATALPIALLSLVVKQEKARRLLLFFLWGIISYVLSLQANRLIFSYIGLGAQHLSISTGPIVEELLKMLPLLIVFLFYFNLKEELIGLGMASGIGFAIQENFQYILSSSQEGLQLIYFVVLRSLSTCLMHGLATAMIGYGIFIMSRAQKRIQPVLFAFFSMAVIFHALFNLLIGSSYHILGTMLPAIIYLLVSLFMQKDAKKHQDI